MNGLDDGARIAAVRCSSSGAGRAGEEVAIATDAVGREGLSAGGSSKELGVSPAKVKRALASLKIEPDFVKSGCAYYYTERAPALKKELTKG